MSEFNVVEFGDYLGELIMRTVGESQAASPRSQQSTSRVLGMSELGGCREYIRASIAGDVKTPEDSPLKWPAFIGTAVGDMMEKALVQQLDGVAQQQEKVTVTLPVSHISVSGSADVQFVKLDYNGELRDAIVDFKSRAELGTVRREGPSFKEWVQVSGYLIGSIQQGKLFDDATAHLVYIDRSGVEKNAVVFSVTATVAMQYLEAADERLTEVAVALTEGKQATRDLEESHCWYIQCPFYKGCWNGYLPEEDIQSEEIIGDVDAYVKYRDLEKEAKRMKDAAKERLRGTVGRTPTHTLNWKLSDRAGGIDSIDVRARRG